MEQPSRLVRAPASALVSFALAGMANFFFGWTFLVLAQQRMGAGRTAVVAATAPLFGTVLAFFTIGEHVEPVAMFGVVLVVVGVGMLAGSTAGATPGVVSGASGIAFGLLTAISWGASAVLARHGLDQVPTPLSGITVGMGASAAAYGIGLAVRRTRRRETPAALDRTVLLTLSLAGLFVAIGIGTQWIAFGLAPLAVVLALNQLAVPVVLMVAPAIVGSTGERMTMWSMVGAAATVGGTLLIIATRAAAS
jgi:drug/metabolite transporter (DMT)-like permease